MRSFSQADELVHRHAIRARAIPLAQRDRAFGHLAVAHHQHVGHLEELCLADLGVHAVVAQVSLRPDALLLHLADQAQGIVVVGVGDGDHSHLVGREPDGEVTGEVLDEEADHALVGAERGAVDAQGRLLLPVAVDEVQVEAPGLGKIHLVGGQGELLADHRPDLHVDLGSIESCFIRHLFVGHVAVIHRPAHHVLGLEPQALVIDVFLAQAALMVGAQAHHVLIDAENFKVLVVQVDDSHELLLELVFSAVHVGIVHLHRAHAHQPKQLAALFVTVAGSRIPPGGWASRGRSAASSQRSCGAWGSSSV